MADVIPFRVITIPFELKASITPKENVLHAIKKIIFVELSVYPCFKSFWRINISGCVIHGYLKYSQVEVYPLDAKKHNNVWSKHYRLRDSKLAEGSLRLSTDTKKNKKICRS